MKRSLLLFHLWSRCGLKPRLHLGYSTDSSGTRRGHAWVTLATSHSATAERFEPYEEAYVFEA